MWHGSLGILLPQGCGRATASAGPEQFGSLGFAAQRHTIGVCPAVVGGFTERVGSGPPQGNANTNWLLRHVTANIITNHCDNKNSIKEISDLKI